jgi:hypothetical protein
LVRAAHGGVSALPTTSPPAGTSSCAVDRTAPRSGRSPAAAAFVVAPLDAVDMLIVDDQLPDGVDRELADAGIEVVKVAV